jgi:acyl-ACP thioesterase
MSWIEKHRVRPFDVDAFGSMRAASLMRFLQLGADGHARSAGLAVDQLLREGRTWVLREFHFEVDRYPRLYDEFEVETWAAERTSSLRAWRDYVVRDAAGNRIAAGGSQWLMLDSRTWRPVKLAQAVQDLISSGRAVPMEMRKLPKARAITGDEASVDVHWLDLDNNGHVNNVRYLDWLFECLPDDLWKSRELSRFAIEYLDEARPGDSLRIVSREEDPGMQHQIRHSDRRVLIHAYSEWRERDSLPPNS